MRLVIISSDPDGKVGLVSEAVFPDAVAATRELARLFAEGSADASASFYTVDMDTAVPVIILQHPVAKAEEAVAEADEPEAAVEDAEEEPAITEEPAEEPEADDALVAEAAEPVAEVESEGPVVEDESEELVAEVEPEEAAVAEAEPDVADEEPAEDAEPPAIEEEIEPAAETATEAEAEPEVEPVAEEAPREEPAPQWPWDLPVVAPEGAVDASEESGTEEPAPPAPVEDDDGITAFVPVPDVPDVTIIPGGADDDVADFAAVVETEVVADSADAPVAVEVSAGDAFGFGDLGLPEMDAAEVAEPAAVETIDVVAEPQSVIDLSAAPAGSSEAAAEEVGTSERVYEPGALNMSEYTCDDCVYVNTCPNQHQKKPAECGSFQWRSV